MSQLRDPSNDFIEFVQVWGGSLNLYLDGVIMYDSRNGRFTVQVGYKIDEGKLNGNPTLKIITTTGAVIRIQRQQGRDIGTYTVVDGGRKVITATRTDLQTA